MPPERITDFRPFKFSRRSVAHSGHLDHSPICENLPDSHLPLCERACLIRAYHGCTAQDLNGRHLPHQGIFFGHLVHPDSKSACNNSCQRFGDRCHGKGNRKNDHGDDERKINPAA